MGGLGFRDIHNFNIAMLSRQAWRLLQQPESLCAQILSARYYPDGDMLSATPTDGISYAWRSILHGIKLVKEGYIWRIGNGESVRIWDDPWIPKLWDRKISSPRNGNLLEKVAGLISPVTGTWDDQLVSETFSADDTRLILSMPVSANVEDFIAWHFDEKGLHSVKQAYKLQVQLVENEQKGGRSGSTSLVSNLNSGGHDCWCRIWNAPCPPKIKMFVWRAVHNSLALRPNLQRRGVQIDNVKCLFCNGDVEEGAHLFIKCEHVMGAWRELGLEDVRMELAMSTSVLHALDIIWKTPVVTRLQIMTLWWLWWSNRNKLREGDITLDAAAVAHQARFYVAEYMEILGKKEKDKTREQTIWTAPDQDVLKFNIDGAFSKGHNHAGWGVVVRDHRGDVVAATAGQSEYVSDAFHAELCAAVQAVRLAEYLGAINVVLETDSQLLMLALNRRDANVSPLGLIIDELKF
jgi:hypothetical protein